MTRRHPSSPLFPYTTLFRSPAATELIRPLSFQAITQRPVLVEMFGMLNQTEISHVSLGHHADVVCIAPATAHTLAKLARSEEHTSELQSQSNLVCRLLLEKK